MVEISLTVESPLSNNENRITKEFNKDPEIKIKHAIIFAMYSKDRLIDDNLVKYLSELRKFSDYIVLVSDSFINKNEIYKLENLVDYVDLYRHGEYDFGSYKRGFNFLKKQLFFKKLEYITFCNDSIEYLGESLEEYFAKQKGNDAFGLTISNYAFRLYDPKKSTCQEPHIQSFFITLSKKIYINAWFSKFINRIKKRPKEEISIKYEVGLSDLIQKKGFKIESYYPINIYTDPAGYYLNLDSPYKGKRLFIKKSKLYSYVKINPNEVDLFGQGASFLEIKLKKLYQALFSIKNSKSKEHKVVTILGVKISIRRKFLQQIFSISNKQSSNGKWHKIIYILGIKISFRNRRKEERLALKTKLDKILEQNELLKIDFQIAMSYINKIPGRKGLGSSQSHENDFIDPKFSIIMPTYNRFFCICDAINSLLHQTYQNFELIIIDDGSSDDTVHLIKDKYAEELKQDKIRYIRTEQNNGVCTARNIGLKYAKNAWIGYLDTDNQMMRDYLEQYVSAIKQKLGYVYYAKIKSSVGSVTGAPFDYNELKESNYIDLGVFVHHKSFVNKYGNFDTNLKRLVDWDLILRYTKFEKPYFIDQVLLEYNDGQDYDRISNQENCGTAFDFIQEKLNIERSCLNNNLIHKKVQFLKEGVLVREENS